MVYEEKVSAELWRFKLRYFRDQFLEMPTPILVPLTYRIPYRITEYGMSEHKAAEAEEDYYCMWRFHYIVLTGEQRWKCLCIFTEDKVEETDVRASITARVGPLHLYQLSGGGGYRRGGNDSGGGELVGRSCRGISIVVLHSEDLPSCFVGAKTKSTACMVLAWSSTGIQPSHVALSKRYKASDMESGKDTSVLELRTVRAGCNKCQPHEKERINSSSSSPNKRFVTKNLESAQRERRKIRGVNKELSKGNKRLKRAKDFGSRRWQYNSVVGGKLDSTASSYSDTEVSTSGQTNGSDNEGEGGLEQFLGFLGQLVSYPPGSDAFREFCKAKAAVGEKWGKCVDFAGRQLRVGRAWNDNIIWVKGNFLQRDDDEPLDLRFRSVKQSKCESTVERKESLLDKVAEKKAKNSNSSWGNSSRRGKGLVSDSTRKGRYAQDGCPSYQGDFARYRRIGIRDEEGEERAGENPGLSQD
ncbi:hypothetical protein GIB67_032373 [Kingdonia uniflora]|uniref:Uncharacterized protein n=1 Tax=Kingdonia uniflora TaxID=39325 RepID=A0A7J7MIT4_9MAGN|nr:hypothetical protein GIB67_032373 [Kingdonia uniflora]